MAGESETGRRLTDIVDPAKNSNRRERMIAERIQKSSISERLPEEDLLCIVDYLSDNCAEKYINEQQAFKRGIYLSYHILE
jgi:hypothetical protein